MTDRPKQVQRRGTPEAEIVHWDFIPVSLPASHPLFKESSIACGAGYPYLPDRHNASINEVTCPDCKRIAFAWGGLAGETEVDMPATASQLLRYLDSTGLHWAVWGDPKRLATEVLQNYRQRGGFQSPYPPRRYGLVDRRYVPPIISDQVSLVLYNDPLVDHIHVVVFAEPLWLDDHRDSRVARTAREAGSLLWRLGHIPDLPPAAPPVRAPGGRP